MNAIGPDSVFELPEIPVLFRKPVFPKKSTALAVRQGDYSLGLQPRHMALEFDRMFFVTTVCERRRPVFRNHDAAKLLMETLFRYQNEGRFLLHAFVIMPDHLHLVIAPHETISLEKAMQFIKGGFSFQYGKAFGGATIWQRGFSHERIKDEAEFRSRRDYVENNPVRASLVSDPAAYPYSSAFRISAAAKAGSE